jgi:hypothetical protein
VRCGADAKMVWLTRIDYYYYDGRLACMASPLVVPGDLRAVSWSSFALRYAFAFTGVRIRLNQFLHTQLVTLLMQTPQLYARNAVRTSVNVAVDEAGCTIAGKRS